MSEKAKRGLKERIREEMMADYANILERNFELAKQFIHVTSDGKVDVLLRDKLTGKEQILLYLIGKLYAKLADYTPTEDVGNKELVNELGIPIGSLLPWLKTLRDSNKIRSIKRGKYTNHVIPISLVERVLRFVDKKIKGVR